MEDIDHTSSTDRDQQNWRTRLEAALLDYCARNDASPEDAVTSVSNFLRDAPASDDRLTRAELRHRVRNEMQLLISSMRKRRRAMTSNRNAGCDSCIGQVVAMAHLNGALDCGAPGQRVDLAAHCAQIAVDMRKALNLDDKKIRLEIQAEPILVSAEKARNVVLILNEALTNAIKHAFGDDGGTVRVKMARTSSRESELSVTDDGRGSAALGDGGSGGSLIAALASQIDGRIDRGETSSGFRLSCAFPVD